MKKASFDAYIVPHSDAHNNEYLADVDERLQYICNFSGSNGKCLITQSLAYCWTDGRYYLQCPKELYPGWTMQKMGRGENSIVSVIKETLKPGSKIGVDFNLLTNDGYNHYSAQLVGYELVNDSNNLIDQLWQNKPTYSREKVLIHELKHAGETCLQKYQRVYKSYKELSAFHHSNPNTPVALFIVRLDDIAWLTNLRGFDISFNPLFFSYAILYIDPSQKADQPEMFLHLFSDRCKFDSNEISSHLSENKIRLFDYNDALLRISDMSDIEDHSLKQHLSRYTLIIDTESVNQNVFSLIISSKVSQFTIEEKDFVEFTKYVKNDTEIQGLIESNLRDAAALVRYLAWLENELIVNKTQLNEYDAAEKCEEFRKQGDFFMGLSFDTISSTGPNAAIIHYKPSKTESSVINPNHVYLLDSGGHYLDGTTDTTRTVYFNDSVDAGQKQREMYTRVLLGNLAIERSRFIKRWGVSGSTVDSIARHSLWHVGEDFMHATGHGVGYFLNVHEGPNGIYNRPDNPAFRKGMVTSNEPGYYLTDHFGIRIENVIYVDEFEQEGKEYLRFVNMALVPYERNLLDFNLLSNDYIDYINAFHKECYEKVSPLLKKFNDDLAIKYLEKKTKPIERFKF